MCNNLLLFSLVLSNWKIIQQTFSFKLLFLDPTLSVTYDKISKRIYISQNDNPVCVINPTWLLAEIKKSRRED